MKSVLTNESQQTTLRLNNHAGFAFLDYLIEKSKILGITVSTFVVFAIYVVLGTISYFFVIPPDQSAVFWIPSGFTFFLFIRTPHLIKVWPFWIIGLFCAESLVIYMHALPKSTMLLWSLANITLCLTTGIIGRIFNPGILDFRQLRDVLTFAVISFFAVIPGSVIATLGAVTGGLMGSVMDTTRHSASDQFRSQFFSFAASWAISDGLGILLIAPVLLTWTAPGPKIAGQKPEALALFSILVFFSVLIFFYSQKMALLWPYMTFLFYFVAWGSIRFGPKSTTLALLIIDVLEVLGTKNSIETFINLGLSIESTLVRLQIITANLGLLMLLLAAAIEEQRTARCTSEKALKSRDDFLLIASHELKTPITALQIQIDLINRLIRKKQIVDLEYEKQVKLADVSVTQIRRLNVLIDQLLDVSRVSGKKVSISTKLFDLSDLVRNIANHFKKELSKANCELKLSIDENIQVKWDPDRMEQVLSNLISNAIKYGPGKPIEISVHSTNEHVEIRIQDYGLGISLDDQQRIFKRFERASSFRTYGGLGLGLYIANQIVEAHGGTIRIESKIDEGSTFVVDLPRYT